MTLTDFIFSIPGLIAMTFIVPCLLALTIDWIRFTIDTVQDHQEPEQETSQPAPRPANVIDFDTVAAISHIRNHEAMQFIAKG